MELAPTSPLLINENRMLVQLILHEGEKLKFYPDTLGNITVGIGYNRTGRGLGPIQTIIKRVLDAEGNITKEEAELVCREDIRRVDASVRIYFPTYNNLNEVRRRVCADMAFNMGFKALGFKQTMLAIAREDWSGAVRELYKSKWAYEVGDGPGGRLDRCDRLTKMLLTGEDYTA